MRVILVVVVDRVEPSNEFYDGERDNDRDDAAVDV